MVESEEKEEEAFTTVLSPCADGSTLVAPGLSHSF